MEWSKKIIVPPSPGDSGSPLGAAIFGAIQEFNVGLDFLHKLSADANIGPELEALEDMPHLFKQVKTDACIHDLGALLFLATVRPGHRLRGGLAPQTYRPPPVDR